MFDATEDTLDLAYKETPLYGHKLGGPRFHKVKFSHLGFEPQIFGEIVTAPPFVPIDIDTCKSIDHNVHHPIECEAMLNMTSL